jgi:fatty-acid desaturase
MRIKLLLLFNHVIFLTGLFLVPDLWWLSLLGVIIIGKIGGEIGLHKWISHKSIEFNPITKQIILFLGALNGFGSHISWAGVHRKHHAKSDTDEDPHGSQPKWRIWSTFWLPFHIEVRYVKDLLKDKSLRFYHEHYFKIIFISYVIICAIDWRFWMLFVCGGSALSFHQAGIVNAFGHNKNEPVNNHIVTLLSFGSGYHKNHHDRSKETVNGFFDIPGWIATVIGR